MSISIDTIPRFAPSQAKAIAAEAYGACGALSSLPSERDQNFLIASDEGKRVLKIANESDSAALLDFQNQAMRRVAQELGPGGIPRIVPNRAGQEITKVKDPATGKAHLVRLLTWTEGEVLARCPSRTCGLFETLGANLARMDAALCDFTHPAMHRVLQWDLRHAPLAERHLPLLPPPRRVPVEAAFAGWRRIDWTALRHGVIHGDANDHNVIVRADGSVGFLDFGDMVYSATVCELAIALAYGLLGARAPMAAAAALVRGYQRRYPLTAAERRVLIPLVHVRLAMSVCYSAHNKARNPGDPYQTISEAPAWALLETLAALRPEQTLAVVEAACVNPEEAA